MCSATYSFSFFGLINLLTLVQKTRTARKHTDTYQLF
uniref:Uncharacterized protein n=1 Tax=Arundo donax TaxID=35708 RepID=A0A0A9CGD8_ARUDO